MSTRISQAKIPPGRGPQKPKSNKKKLFFLFFSAFVVFFFFCTFIASMLTPAIDVPALKKDDNFSTVTSDDFKGRIDPKLKELEMQEDSAPAQTSNATATSNTQLNSSTSIDTSTPDSKVTETNTDILQENTVSEDFEKIPYNSEGDSGTMQKANTDQVKTPNPSMPSQPPISGSDNISAPKKPAEKKKTAPAPANKGLMLRDKIDQAPQREPVNMKKVIIDGYSSPGEAKRISEELTNSNLNVTPFIK